MCDEIFNEKKLMKISRNFGKFQGRFLTFSLKVSAIA